MDAYNKFNNLTEEFIYFLSDKLTDQNEIDLLQKLNTDLLDLKNANYTAPFLLFYKSIYEVYGKDLEKNIDKVTDPNYINKIKKLANHDNIMIPLIELIKSYPDELKKMIKSGINICKEKSKANEKK